MKDIRYQLAAGAITAPAEYIQVRELAESRDTDLLLFHAETARNAKQRRITMNTQWILACFSALFKACCCSTKFEFWQKTKSKFRHSVLRMSPTWFSSVSDWGIFHNTTDWGRGEFRAPVLSSTSETTGPIFKIQAAFDSPAKVVERSLILFTSGSPMTSQVRSK